MADTTIYHNPRCGKSRLALELLREEGIEPVIVEYLKKPPDRTTLQKILTLLGGGPRDMMRQKELEYRKNDLKNPDLSAADLLDAMVKYPKLIERPIVLHGGKAAIGRPIDNIRAIL